MLTAVDILFEKIKKIPFQSPDARALYDDIIKLYEESKEIEKQQKKVDYQSGYVDCYMKYKINERKFNT
jgi:hypothetical protein